MKKIRLLTLLALGLFVGTAYAQVRVSGVVRGADDGQPLAGVTVQVKGTAIAAITNADGSYTINNAPSNATLSFSYAGMRKQEIPTAGKTAVNVTLMPDAIDADAVVVTALGGTKLNRKLGYSVTEVKSEDLMRTNALNIANALQGKVAGLSVRTSGSAGVTGDPVITLRGAKSLTKTSSPIYVIDGVIIEAEINNPGNEATGGYGSIITSSRNMYGSQLKNLNMDDYESVTVLKGAAATSLYGSRGINGAIVLTSKQGKARKGIGVDVSYSHEFTNIYRPPMPIQNTYGQGYIGNGYEGNAYDNPLRTDDSYDGWSFGPAMDGTPMLQWYKIGSYGNPAEPFVAYKDNWREVFQTAKSDRVSVNLTGGSDKANFRLGYAYRNVDGSMPTNNYYSHNVSFNTNGKLNDIFSVNFNFMYSLSNTHNAVSASGEVSNNDYLSYTMEMINRNTDLAWYKANYRDAVTNELLVGDTNKFINAIFDRMKDNNTDHKEQSVLASLTLSAQPLSWLDAAAMITYNSVLIDNTTKNYGTGLYREGGSYSINGNTYGTYNFRGWVHSNNRFVDDNLELDVRLIYELYGNIGGNYWSKQTRGGLVVPGLFAFSNSKEPLQVADYEVRRNARNTMTMGLAASVNLSWKDQINLELNARNDWVSTLTYPAWIVKGANNYSVFYPGANLAWMFTDTFDINPNIISSGKLRASIAQVGSGANPYDTSAGAGGITMSQAYNAFNEYQFRASPSIGSLPNYDLKPEISQSMEIGADIRFLNGILGLDVAYYKTNNKNQILRIGAANEAGVSTQVINAGNIQNQGWEVALTARPFQGEFRWDMTFNWFRNRSKIVEFHPAIHTYQLSNNNLKYAPYIFAFEGGAFGQIVAGTSTYGQGAAAKYTDPNNPNNPLNGKYYLKSLGSLTTVNTDAQKSFLPLVTWTDAGSLSNYYRAMDKDANGKDIWGTGYLYDVLGNVEPDFEGSFLTNLAYKNFDLFVQVDARIGGSMISTNVRDAIGAGNAEASMYFRTNGEARVNYLDQTVFDGVVMDGVFGGATNMQWYGKSNTANQVVVDLQGLTMREAVEMGYMQPMAASAYYTFNFHRDMSNGTSALQQRSVSEVKYVSLREITLGYNFPQKWIKHLGLQYARLAVTARNLCYLYNGMLGGSNPESISLNNPLTPIDYGGVPFARNFNLKIDLRF